MRSSFGQQINLKVQGRASMRLRFQMVLTDQNETRQKDRLERDQKGEKRERIRIHGPGCHGVERDPPGKPHDVNQ